MLIVAALLVAGLTGPHQTALQTTVWVNSNTHVYHCPGDQFYGNSRDGEYMSEASARARGNRASQGDACPVGVKRVKLLPLKLGDVWVNTESNVYYCPSNKLYGNTKRGRFLPEKDAIAAKVRPATKKCG